MVAARSPRPRRSADAQGSAAEAAPAQGALAMVPAWCTDFAAMEAHVATYAHPLAVERCARKHRAGLLPAARELLALRYQRLSWDPHDGEVTIESARRLVATWIAQGPVERVVRRPARRSRGGTARSDHHEGRARHAGHGEAMATATAWTWISTGTSARRIARKIAVMPPTGAVPRWRGAAARDRAVPTRRRGQPSSRPAARVPVDVAVTPPP